MLRETGGVRAGETTDGRRAGGAAPAPVRPSRPLTQVPVPGGPAASGPRAVAQAPASFRDFTLQSRWQPAARLRRAEMGERLRDCLLGRGSLTARLRAECARHGRAFSVRVLSERAGRVLREEADALGLRRGVTAWVREVHLLAGGVPWVFARTVIPRRTLRGHGRTLTGLGTRPLGAVLFADPGVVRGPLQIARLDLRCPLARRALDVRGASGLPLWGRRSTFRIDGRPLLVCEVFLPALADVLQA